MKEIKKLPVAALLQFPAADDERAQALIDKALLEADKKIVVLDDDPTGVQTVHAVSVYTDWKKETLEAAFTEPERMFFILTNSRGMTVSQTEKAHREIAQAIYAASQNTGKDFILISRSDSTLRGHYPTETETLKNTLEMLGASKFDGEIIYPYFKEGGRFTFGNVHYVREKDMLVPAGMTEFSKDLSFGYSSSDLAAWCEEKSHGVYKADQVVCISLEDLRLCNIDKITDQLLQVKGFGKVIVNSIDYADVKVFATAFLNAIKQGKRFLFRSAAAITKVLGGVPDRPLLSREELVSVENTNGGIVLVGSHVNKTTQQIEELKNCRFPLEYIEFNQHLVLEPGGLEKEVARVISLAEEKIQAGKSVVVYTRRDRFDLPDAGADRQLELSVQISDAVTSIIGKLKVRPSFIIAKGGITSSDVGVKALRVHCAMVMGQIKPGIPVWMTGPESKFPDMPYVIFPGNVGETTTLREVVEILMNNGQ